ncbi:AbrB/MazE/SpoVT family DNA-binding domain-containing protein [Lysinibacillus sp. 1P01SD]|uniref:AbrB/MazE/SpoVT family DNA-binding domain-containing protein n=1 Tax=Lysinibacillus sp. 1P01SD TaxID=3132285 RepID=UPI0039A2FBA8
MRSTGIVRKVDELGRVVMPAELRKKLQINEGDPMEVYIDGDKIILKKYQPNMECIVTGEVSQDNLVLQERKIILSAEGAEILMAEIEKVAKGGS